LTKDLSCVTICDGCGDSCGSSRSFQILDKKWKLWYNSAM